MGNNIIKKDKPNEQTRTNQMNKIAEQLSEEELKSQYNAMRQVRRENKKSIVKMEDGTKLTSVVYTSPVFAKKIIDYFSPQFSIGDTFVDPTAGRNAFYDALPLPKDRFEIQDGKDFLEASAHWQWCFCNLPWKGKTYSALALKTFQTCDNVISLCKFSTALGTTKRFNDAIKHNMYLKEIHFVSWKDAAFTFTDGTPKAPEGFILAVFWWQKDWKEGTQWKQGLI